MMIDEATEAQLEAKLDDMSRARDEKWRLARRKQVDAAIKLIRFDPGISVEQRRWAVEHELAELEEFDVLWRVWGQPVTKNSKRAAGRLANALKLHVEKALTDPDLSLEFRRYSAELADLRKRAETAASQKIGSKKGRGQKEALRRKFAVQATSRLMRHSKSNADQLNRFVKLCNLLYSGKAVEAPIFERLCKEASRPYDLNRIAKRLGLK
ncbi:hypothetical protein FXB41_32150 [Bradyrhizobium canariense]|uniref:hypothetical protein n=1 Tax=Bradyrhizobium canariense TaxID=255045 RepID=UPI001CA5E8D5|nr:hypothetical protein [Bradyrhizobium canariense]MBW5439254.1 hypothetical protein [Bradyrhizobium canariense]